MKKLIILSTVVFATVSMTSCQNQNEVLLPKSVETVRNDQHNNPNQFIPATVELEHSGEQPGKVRPAIPVSPAPKKSNEIVPEL
ncbi:hypothetical protein SAMN04515674_10296 [Pseudarcicella hirudinis]|uniref:Uncharacterized protein n=1 Tax=Pseudarcicella hirudinis TaxID=1079859 RepID=A0A1I5NSF9_9BACT|nr:hypothetical protein [Pseudarcicella hirudinis]SFP24713.1 hypothetical protein SAMN04515674_10296 [Pseudarcicella hirudinis]